MNAQSLIKRLNVVLNKVNATERKVYKRVIARTGGDALLGRPGSVSVVDTLLNPQPAVRQVTQRDTMMVDGSSVINVAEYMCQVSPTALSQADLNNKDTVLVFKGGVVDEEFVVVGADPDVLNGTVVMWNLAIKSRKQ